MSEGALQMRRLGIESLDSSREMMLEAVETEQIAKTQDSIQRKESAKKKKKDQEKDALKRAQTYQIKTRFAEKAEEVDKILQERQNFLDHARQERLPDDWKAVRVGASGKEFAPDPQTGEMDIEGMLHKCALLNAKVAMYKKNGKNADLKEQSMMEVNMEILELMKDARNTWFAASGVDIKSGKKISAGKQKDAQQHLELAMQRYREVIENCTL